MNYGAINIVPETMGGTPVFTGTKVSIISLFDYIETGETLDEFLENFPSVHKEHAIQGLEMAKKTLTTERILHEKFAYENMPTKVNYDFVKAHEVRNTNQIGKEERHSNIDILGQIPFLTFT